MNLLTAGCGLRAAAAGLLAAAAAGSGSKGLGPATAGVRQAGQRQGGRGPLAHLAGLPPRLAAAHGAHDS